MIIRINKWPLRCHPGKNKFWRKCLGKYTIIFLSLTSSRLIIDCSQQILCQPGHTSNLHAFIPSCILKHLLIVDACIFFVPPKDMSHSFIGMIHWLIHRKHCICGKICSITDSPEFSAGIQGIHTFQRFLKESMRMIHNDISKNLLICQDLLICQLTVIIDQIQTFTFSQFFPGKQNI